MAFSAISVNGYLGFYGVMKTKNDKTIATLSCILGVFGVMYGMSTGNNIIFIVGLLFVAGGYLMIRRKLKGDAQRQIR